MWWLKILAVIVIFFAGENAYAQRILAEGRIDYVATVEDEGDEEGLSKAFEGAGLTVWIKGNRVRTDFNSKLRSQSVIYKGADLSAVILRGTSGDERYLTELDSEQWKHYNRKYLDLENLLQPDTLIIAGYNCRLALLRLKDSSEISVYYTTDIIPITRGYDAAFAGLEGLPVQYEIRNGKVLVKYTLTTLQTIPIVASRFTIDKSGYKLLVYNNEGEQKN